MKQFSLLKKLAITGIAGAISMVGFLSAQAPANAGVTQGSDAASNRYYKWCIDAGSGEDFCTWASIFIDPIGDSIKDFSITMQYDPAMWTFRPDESGFMCQFSTGGYCLKAEASYGTSLIEKVFEPKFGLPASGTANITYPTADTVSLTVTFDTPVSAVEETNMYAFIFEPTASNPLDLNRPLYATYYDTVVSNATFVQTKWTCTTDSGSRCGSNTPVRSGVITSIPEPTSTFGLLALGTLGAASTLKRKLKSSKSSEKETTTVS